MTIKEKLGKKTITEINAIAKRLGYPLRGGKQERIHSLDGFFKEPARWKAIIGK